MAQYCIRCLNSKPANEIVSLNHSTLGAISNLDCESFQLTKIIDEKISQFKNSTNVDLTELKRIDLLAAALEINASR